MEYHVAARVIKPQKLVLWMNLAKLTWNEKSHSQRCKLYDSIWIKFKNGLDDSVFYEDRLVLILAGRAGRALWMKAEEGLLGCEGSISWSGCCFHGCVSFVEMYTYYLCFFECLSCRRRACPQGWSGWIIITYRNQSYGMFSECGKKRFLPASPFHSYCRGSKQPSSFPWCRVAVMVAIPCHTGWVSWDLPTRFT